MSLVSVSENATDAIQIASSTAQKLDMQTANDL